jgi:hypothetical protein
MTKFAAPKRALAGLAAAGLVSTMLVLGMATPASAALPTAPTPPTSRTTPSPDSR